MKRRDEGPRTRPMEWLLAGASALLLAGMVGYLAWEGIARPDGPPQVVVLAGEPRAVAGGFLVEFTARNDGRSSAANVQIVGELGQPPDGVLERSEAVLDYVPEGSTRRGWLRFTRDPARHGLAVMVGGQTEP